MKQLLFAIVLLAALLVRAEARLGETKEQLEERYGKAEKEGNVSNVTVMFFYKDSFKITCLLRGNSVFAVTYNKKNKWNDDEIEQVLNKNAAQGAEWEMMDTASDVTKVIYKTKDGARVASYYPLKNELFISLESEVQRVKAENQKTIDAL